LYRGEGESLRRGDGNEGSKEDEKKNQARRKR
jgi:hypothetical protein